MGIEWGEVSGFTTVGLGVRDLIYRIIALLFVSVVSGIDPVQKHNHSERKAGDSVP